jgi:hypothetical protein
VSPRFVYDVCVASAKGAGLRIVLSFLHSTSLPMFCINGILLCRMSKNVSVHLCMKSVSVGWQWESILETL